ncbi:MAG TPA: RES family NAD+ phosphorylase [Candidatus Acidoferrum sp.]|nr:RES family NAD+ phosphorylase [Candidatus Acidoferrum sp.]
MSEIALCSNCFHDRGLRLDAERIGIEETSLCLSCGSPTGRKLNRDLIAALAHRFFVWGTIHRCEYGAAPVVQFNEQQCTCISASPWFEADLRKIETALGVGFFYYGPRLWMVGEVEPLKALQDPETRRSVTTRIIAEYPSMLLPHGREFYRIRLHPTKPDQFGEYDSPPSALAGSGRLDSAGFPVMYASQDLQICIHECRATAEDDLYLATLAPTRELQLLDLTELLQEEKVTEFESLDMAVHMLFLAGKHSYEISRDLARAAHAAGFDGLVYPSYFSLLRTGGMPFETAFGISYRRFPQLANCEKAKIIPNLALFGRPIEQGSVSVRCINKLILNRVEYGIQFGPVGC